MKNIKYILLSFPIAITICLFSSTITIFANTLQYPPSSKIQREISFNITTFQSYSLDNTTSKKATDTVQLNVSDKKVQLNTGESYQSIILSNDNRQDPSKFKYSSSNQSIATVDANGVVKGISRGKIKIRISSLDNKAIDEYTVLVINPLENKQSSFIIITQVILITLVCGIFIFKYQKFKTIQYHEESKLL